MSFPERVRHVRGASFQHHAGRTDDEARLDIRALGKPARYDFRGVITGGTLGVTRNCSRTSSP